MVPMFSFSVCYASQTIFQNTAKSLEDWRKTVCFLCLKKCDQQVTHFMKQRMNKYFHQKVVFNDKRDPLGICNSCKSELQKRDNGQKEGELLKLFDFQTIRIKRRSSDCNCTSCQI